MNGFEDTNDYESDGVYASLIRSPIDDRCWVPMLPDTDVWDSVFAGGLRKVKEAAYERVQRNMLGQDTTELVWVREDDSTWVLVPKGWKPGG